MKTVGIATIHAINNFGSLLQAFATQTVVERLGYKTSIINLVFLYIKMHSLKENFL